MIKKWLWKQRKNITLLLYNYYKWETKRLKSNINFVNVFCLPHKIRRKIEKSFFFNVTTEKKSSLFGFAKRKLLLKSWVWKTWKENFLKEFYHQPANFSTVVIQNKCFLYPMPIFATPFTIKPLPLPYYVLVPLPPNLLN